MDVITPLGLGFVDTKTFNSSGNGSELAIRIKTRDNEKVSFTRRDVVPLSSHGIIRIVSQPDGLIGNLQFHQLGAVTKSIFGHERPADESLIAINRIKHTVQISDGVQLLRGIVILQPWVDRWGRLRIFNGLSISDAVTVVHELEDKTCGTTVGVSSLVAIDTTNSALLYLSLWCLKGIIRSCHHEAFTD